MQEQVYVDLFGTKGVEYILVTGYLLALVGFWRLLKGRAVPPRSPAPQSVAPSGWFAVPRDRYYHPGHSWAQPTDDGLVTIGMDDFAQKLIGNPTSIELPRVGAHIAQGEPGSRLNVAGKSVALLSPVDGEVIAHNAAVLDGSDLINCDPYGAGWLMKVKPSRMAANVKNLLAEPLVAAWIEMTEHSLRRLMSRDLGVVLQDGGVPITGIARGLSEDRWDEIAQDFLLTREMTSDTDRGGRDDARTDHTP